jgi:heme o synthase
MNTCNGCRKNSSINRPLAGREIGPPLRSRMVDWLHLIKLPVCLLVAFSTLFGSVLAGPVTLSGTMPTVLGMLLLACGSAALNSLQEIQLDASMARTKDRPLPQGRISGCQAGVLALLLIAAGLWGLYLGSHVLRTVGLGLVAVVLYNLVYTTLKTRTVAAIIPGALSGALPPYIGWSAAGGDPLSGTAFLLCGLFVLWQVPHSLLIVLSHKDDYLRNDMPSLIKLFPESSLKRILMVWTGAFFTVLLFFTGVPMGLTDGVRAIVWISVFVVFISICLQMPRKRRPDYQVLFIQQNLYLFFIMVIFISDKVFFC